MKEKTQLIGKENILIQRLKKTESQIVEFENSLNHAIDERTWLMKQLAIVREKQDELTLPPRHVLG